MLERLVDMLGGHGLHVGYAFVFFVLVLCGFGLPMPEDVVLATGGVLAWLASDLDHGTVAGDTIIFLAGRRFGHRIADVRPLRRIITPAKLEAVEKHIRRRGNLVVVIARFLPGLRAPTFFTVGHARMPLWEFLLFDGAAALVSAPLWICLGFCFGSDLQALAREASRFSHYILLAVGVVLVALWTRWQQARRAATPAAPPASTPVRETERP